MEEIQQLATIGNKETLGTGELLWDKLKPSVLRDFIHPQ
jgi:hypothetical protein